MADKMIIDELNDLHESGCLTLSEIMTVRDAEPSKPAKKIQDWLREDHQRNELKRDVEQLKRDVSRIERGVFITLIFLILTLVMLLLSFSAG